MLKSAPDTLVNHKKKDKINVRKITFCIFNILNAQILKKKLYINMLD
jgi:hypothetical protein